MLKELPEDLEIPLEWISEWEREGMSKRLSRETPEVLVPEIDEITKSLSVDPETAELIRKYIVGAKKSNATHWDITKGIITSGNVPDRRKSEDKDKVPDEREHNIMKLLLDRDKLKKAEEIIGTICKDIGDSTIHHLAESMVLHKCYVYDLHQYVKLMQKVLKYEDILSKLYQKSPQMSTYFAPLAVSIIGKSDEAKEKLREGQVSQARNILQNIRDPIAVPLYNYIINEGLNYFDKNLGSDEYGRVPEFSSFPLDLVSVDSHLSYAYVEPLQMDRFRYALWWLSGLKKVDEMDVSDTNFDENMRKIISRISKISRVSKKSLTKEAVARQQLQKKTKTEELGLMAEQVDHIVAQLIESFEPLEEAPDKFTERWRDELLKEIPKMKQIREEFKKLEMPDDTKMPDDIVVRSLVASNFDKNPPEIVGILKKYRDLNNDIKKDLITLFSSPEAKYRTNVAASGLKDIWDQRDEAAKKLSEADDFKAAAEAIVKPKETKKPSKSK